jgi:hypothetical protein
MLSLPGLNEHEKVAQAVMMFLQETPQNSLENLITFTHAGRQIFADIHNRSYLTVDYLRVT